MKIISYNLLFGAHSNLRELTEFVLSQAPDVVCFQEANGWANQDWRPAREFAAAVGLPHLAGGESNTPFHLVTMSRRPLIDPRVYTHGFFHCAIRVRVPYGDTQASIWNVHLAPWTEDVRLQEAERLIALFGDDQHEIIVGDLNSLSSADDYAPDLIRQLVDKGISKFGSHTLRSDVLARFAAAGLTDAAHLLGTNEWTVPTPASSDANHADRLRLDYALVSQSLTRAVTSAFAEKSAATSRISDHYPLVVTLDEPARSASAAS